MKKRRLMKEMSRRVLSGLFCVLLIVNGTEPMGMPVFAGELQTQESDEKYTTEYLEQDTETQKTDETEEKEEAIETETLLTTQVQSADESEEISDNADAESTETVTDLKAADDKAFSENMEDENNEESKETAETESEATETSEYDMDVFGTVYNGTDGKIHWSVFRSTSSTSITGFTDELHIYVQSEESYEPNFERQVPWKAYVGSISKVVVEGKGSLVNASYMLSGLTKVEEIDLTDFKTDKLENVSHMFDGCINLNTITMHKLGDPDATNKLSGPNVKDMSYMFQNCRFLKFVDLSSSDTSSVENMSKMFAGCSELKAVAFNEHMANVKNMSGIFSGCGSLKTIDLSKFDTSNVEDMSSMFGTHLYDGIYRGCGLESIFFGGNTAHVTNMSGMFSGCTGLKTIDLSKLDSSSVTDMSSMFSGCTGLKQIVFGGDFCTEHVTTTAGMFSGCTWSQLPDFTDLNTSNVTNMSGMFSGCSRLTDPDFSSLDTSNVTNMSGMFSGCRLSGWSFKGLNTSNVENMSYIFSQCLDQELELDMRSLDTGKVTDLSNMFFKSGNLKSVTLDFDTQSVTNMLQMFGFCNQLEEVTFGSSFKADRVTSTAGMFLACEKLKQLNWNALEGNSVKDMDSMFSGCKSLQVINWDAFKGNNVENMQSTFNNCNSLETINWSAFKGNNVENMQSTFNNCNSLKALDLNGFNTGSLTNMWNTFSGCKNLTSIDVSGFNTSNVTNMNVLFYDCSSLTNVDLSNFDTSSVTDMTGIFYGCSSLTSVDLGNFNTNKVTDMSYMFFNCSSLTNVDFSNFDTSNVTNMLYMFSNCSSLTNIDLSNFNTNKVTDMSYMFYNCSSLKELDLRTFDLSKVKVSRGNTFDFIFGCNALSVIHTPLHLNLDQSLPKKDESDRWYQSGMGEDAVVEKLPKNIDYSILLMKNKRFEYPCITAQKTKTEYSCGDPLKLDDLTVTYYNAHGEQTVLTDKQYTTNANELDMNKTGSQTLVVQYEPAAGETLLEASVELNISGKAVVGISGITMEDTVYHAERVSYRGKAVITDKATNEVIDIPLVYSYKGELMDGTPYTENEKAPINAGHYTLVAAVAQDDALYTGSCEFKFTISKAPVTITADDVVVIRNYELPENPEYTYKVEGLLKEDKLIKEPSFDVEADLSTVGVYPIIPSGADAGGNYEISYVEGTFTVSDKKSVKITGIEISSMTYNASPISYKGEASAKLVDADGNITQEDVTEKIGALIYTYSGTLADGTLYDETSDAPKDAGSYMLKVKVSDSNEQYIGTTEYPFEIHKAPVTITAENVSIKMEEELPETFHYKAEGFFLNDRLVKEPSFQCTADTSKEGTYEIVPYDAEAGMNYEIFYENGLLTVSENGGLTAEPIPHQIYTGKAIKPKVRVFFDNEILLTPGKDYTVKYFNNINADTDAETQRKTEMSRNGAASDGFTKEMAYVVITGKGNYAGTVYRNFYIDPAKISEDGIDEAEGVVLKYKDQLVINKKKAQKTFQSIKCKKSMKMNKDFVLNLTAKEAYSNDGKELPAGKEFLEKNVPVIPIGSYGTFELKITGINNYRGTLTKTVYVTEKAFLMKNAKLKLGKNLKSVPFVNGGVRLTPAYYDESGAVHYVESTFKDVSSLNDAFTVFMGKECLKYGADNDYTVTYKNNDKVGTATMIIEGKGKYMGTKCINFKIIGKPFTAKDININKFHETMTYTGEECRQDDIELTDSNGNVINPLCYTISYKNNIKKGTASMTVTANPETGYTGSMKKSYKITAADIATAAAVVPVDESTDKIESKGDGAYHLSGTVLYKKDGAKPIDRISLLLGANREKPIRLVENKDYTVKYTNNASTVPSATPAMTITGKGNLTGTLTVTFNISKTPLESTENLSIKVTGVPYKEKNQESYQYRPKMKVTDGKKVLKEGTDYTISEYVRCSQKEVQTYLQAIEKNEPEDVLQSLRPYAVVAATDSGDYSGTIEADLIIYDTKFTTNMLYVVIVDDRDYSQTTYTGSQIRPRVEVYYGAAKAIKEAKKEKVTNGIILTSKTEKYKLTKLKQKQGQNNGDYTIEYGANIKAGKNAGSISIIGAGRYGGKVTTKFTIQGEDMFGSQVEPWSLFADKMNLIFAK